ncbi:hypothetical protein Hanom_Chr10g00886841 [Helianthus anomalus]
MGQFGLSFFLLCIKLINLAKKSDQTYVVKSTSGAHLGPQARRGETQENASLPSKSPGNLRGNLDQIFVEFQSDSGKNLAKFWANLSETSKNSLN